MYRVIFLICLSLTFLLNSCVNEDNEWYGEGDREVAIGEKVPAFSVVDNNGNILDNTCLTGKASILVFFNTRCGDCRDELPVLQKIYDEYKTADDVVIMTISLSEDNNSISDYWNKHGLTLPYSAQPDKKVYNLFANKVIPMLYVIDKRQVIRYIHTDNPIADYETLYREFNEVRVK